MLPLVKKTCFALLLFASCVQAEALPLPFLDTCVAPPQEGFVPVSVSYKDYLGGLHTVTLSVPQTQAMNVQKGFEDLMSADFPIARLMSFADLPVGGLRQALENNISTTAVCRDVKGEEAYFLILNPAQNPMMQMTLPCTNTQCQIDVLPATSALAINRYLMMSGMMTTVISDSLQMTDHWTYYHHPTPILLLWSVFRLPLAS